MFTFNCFCLLIMNTCFTSISIIWPGYHMLCVEKHHIHPYTVYVREGIYSAHGIDLLEMQQSKVQVSAMLFSGLSSRIWTFVCVKHYLQKLLHRRVTRQSVMSRIHMSVKFPICRVVDFTYFPARSVLWPVLLTSTSLQNRSSSIAFPSQG